MVETQKKSVKKWVLFIVLPVILLMGSTLLQFVVRAALVKTTNGVTTGANSPVIVVVNIISLLIGIVCVLAILLLPLWIYLLIRDSRK